MGEKQVVGKPIDGTLGDMVTRRLWQLSSEALCNRARARTGLRHFGDPPVEPALSILTNSLESEANLHPLGRFLIWGHLLEMLMTRLRLAKFWRGHSAAMASSSIRSPIFITGMPRSGSTFLHELLAQDPDNRCPKVWEVMFPLPAPANGQCDYRRVCKSATRLWWFRQLAPQADEVCPIRACTPHECVAIHSYTFMSYEFVSTCRIPSYETFLGAADLTPVYLWQRRFLEHLQLGWPARRWVLKSPVHVYGLKELFVIFPDAYVIQTHRNPLEVLRSNTQLTRVLQDLYARPGGLSQIGANEARTLREEMERFMYFRDLHPELAHRFIDVSYPELASDPLGVIRRIYRGLEFPLTDAAIQQMRQLISSRSRYHRPHSPTLSDFGLDTKEQSVRFERYCLRFGQQCEPS